MSHWQCLFPQERINKTKNKQKIKTNNKKKKKQKQETNLRGNSLQKSFSVITHSHARRKLQ